MYFYHWLNAQPVLHILHEGNIRLAHLEASFILFSAKSEVKVSAGSESWCWPGPAEYS